jgi:hypothetical protein
MVQMVVQAKVVPVVEAAQVASAVAVPEQEAVQFFISSNALP